MHRPRSRPSDQAFRELSLLCRLESPPLAPVRAHENQFLSGNFHPRPTGHPAVLGADGVSLCPPVPNRHRRELGPHQCFDNGGVMTKTMLELPCRFTLAEDALFQVPAMMYRVIDGQG